MTMARINKCERSVRKGRRRRRIQRDCSLFLMVLNLVLLLNQLSLSAFAFPAAGKTIMKYPRHIISTGTPHDSSSTRRMTRVLAKLNTNVGEEEAIEEDVRNNVGVSSLSLSSPSSSSSSSMMTRRDATTAMALISFAAAATAVSQTTTTTTTTTTTPPAIAGPLEDVSIGTGKWTSLQRSSLCSTSTDANKIVSASFATYTSRFLLRYDNGVSSWWQDRKKRYSLLPEDDKHRKLRDDFASLAKSVQVAVAEFVLEQQQLLLRDTNNYRQGYANLLRQFVDNYDNNNSVQRQQPEEIKRQIGLLFSMLPQKDQPVDEIKQIIDSSSYNNNSSNNKNKNKNKNRRGIMGTARAPEATTTTGGETRESSWSNEDPTALLPPEFRSVQTTTTTTTATTKTTKSAPDDYYYRIEPRIRDLNNNIIGNNNNNQNDPKNKNIAVTTVFGPLATSGLVRDMPRYSPAVYALFGLSGATGCALTHSLVIPLDVVKTRSQTDDSEQSQNLLVRANKILQNEGPQGLLLGSQATVAGYFWYGLSVYPSYTFFKRFLAQGGLLSPEIALANANNIALLAGAIAAVIASLGLTPLEAARIRAVAEPETYRPMGLVGTLQTISREGGDGDDWWSTLYAGLPSLMARQVIFGSIKFLAFERACEALFAAFPAMRDATWTSLLVSLLAGAFAGTLSSVVSQPADSVLTYVAKNKESGGSMGLIEGCTAMVDRDGIGSLFRGTSSRCVWAGSIIAGQFLLYDVFRSLFGVTGDDLSQVYTLVIES